MRNSVCFRLNTAILTHVGPLDNCGQRVSFAVEFRTYVCVVIRPSCRPVRSSQMFTSPNPSIRLKPADWYYATWRNLPPLPRPEPQPFDKDAALEKLRKLRGKWNLSWKQIIPLSMTRAEAQFWFAAFGEYSQHRWQKTPESVAETLANQTFDGQVDAAAIKQLLTQSLYWYNDEEFVVVLFDLLPLPDFIDVLRRMRALPNFINGFRAYVNPYLTHEQREEIHDLIREEVTNQAT